MESVALANRVAALEGLGVKALQTKYYSQYSGDLVDSKLYVEFKTAVLSFINTVYGRDHPYYSEFEAETGGRSSSSVSAVNKGIGILNAIKAEIAGGWLVSMKGLVAAELFTDFIEMANHLLEEGYKDPAAVVIGSVLEEHLRQLSLKHSIDITFLTASGDTRLKKAEGMNTDLSKSKVYSVLDQKMVTAWLDLRNKAAHGKYKEYSAEQVEQMMQGVTNFMSRNSI